MPPFQAEMVPSSVSMMNTAGLPFSMKPLESVLKTMPVGLAVVTPGTAWGGAMVTTSGAAMIAFVFGSTS